jgi:glycopeptide antibiotics resistance protein
MEIFSDVLKKVLNNVLTAFYQPFSAALVMAVLFIFAYMYVNEHGCKGALKLIIENFRNHKRYICLFAFAFYAAMFLFRTIFYRKFSANPLENVIGVWGIHNSKGELYTENIENVILFIPLIPLLMVSFKEKLLKNKKLSFINIIRLSTGISFLISLGIELSQLLFKIGTFQLTDLVFNTLGGLIGGLIYAAASKIRHRKK